jgi:hypothetical protein
MLNIYFTYGFDNTDNDKLKNKINSNSSFFLLDRDGSADICNINNIITQINKEDIVIIDITPDSVLYDDEPIFCEQMMFEYGYTMGCGKTMYIIYNKAKLSDECYNDEEIELALGTKNVYPYDNIDDIYNFISNDKISNEKYDIHEINNVIDI